jgi:ankyrin repeat protein
VTLDETYQRTLREIKETKWESAKRLLVCVTVAARPLRVEELAETLAFDFKSGAIPKFHEDWRLKNPVEAVLSACSTLLSVVSVKSSPKSSGVVQFAHFTVKDFLTSSRFAEKYDNILRRYHISMLPAHTFMTQACLGLLLHLDENITSRSLAQLPFAEYAARYWFEHARFEGVSQHAVEGMKQLFDRTKPHLSIWLWIHDPTVPYWEERERAEGPSPPCGTPLHYAAVCGLHDIAKILAIEHPQDVVFQSVDDGSSPLHLASRGGHVDLARMLVERGADVSAQDQDGSTALHLACRKGHVELAQMLLKNGADVSAQDRDGSTVLHFVSRYGHMDLARILIERGTEVAAQDLDGSTALHLTCRKGHADIARMLIEHGANISAQEEDKSTALHLASENGHVDLAKMLLRCGADVLAQDQYMWTALHLASLNGHVDLARVLIERGADVSAKNEAGWTALLLASRSGDVDIVEVLIKHGADVSVQTRDGRTALHFASRGGYFGLAQTLLDLDADVSAQNEAGWTALHLASRDGRVGLAEMLVERGADVSAQTKDGWTALHLALENGHAGIVRMLVERSPDIASQATPQITTTTTPAGVHVNSQW